MARRKKTKVTADEFHIFDERAAKGHAVAQAIDNQTPIPRHGELVIDGPSVRVAVKQDIAENLFTHVCLGPRPAHLENRCLAGMRR